MNFFRCVVVLILFASAGSDATGNDSTVLDVSGGIKSKVLQTDIHVQLFSKMGSRAKTLLIVLDGQHYFEQAVAANNALFRMEEVPEVSVVGINLSPSQRSEMYYQKPDQFNKFIASELMPYVESQGIKISTKIIFGWELAGSFLLDTLAQQPTAFDGYIAASPTPVYGSYFPAELKSFERFKQTLVKGDMNNSFFYFTEANHDFPVQYGMKNLVAMMEKYAPHAFEWQHQKLMNETHQSLTFKTLFNGMKSYYAGYSYLKIDGMGLDEFKKRGGIKYFEDYHAKRKKRFNFNDEKLAEDSVNSINNLILQSISEDDYASFDKFMDYFFVDIKALKDIHPNQANNFATFYLKNQQYDKALRIIDFLLKQDSGSAKAMNNKGDVYFQMHHHNKAVIWHQKAVDEAKKINHWRLAEFQLDLDKSQAALID